ncbi:MAG: biotin-dependent carboxyltransferase family protein [Chitinophagaceae bacterium]
MSIKVLKTGILASLQDQGRRGYQRIGVPVSGAMDKHAASVANLLCGNDRDEAVIECTLQGSSFSFLEDHLVAFSGSGSVPQCGGRELPVNKAIFIPSGKQIDLTYSNSGCRMYMAIAGGFQSVPVMGSRSTYIPAGAGKSLQTGDILRRNDLSNLSENILKKMRADDIRVAKWGSVELLIAEKMDTIRVMKGAEWNWFSEKAQKQFLNHEYRLSSLSDRMGYRLEGEMLEMKLKEEMISTAVTMGTIQVVHGGMPLILMADAQTTGGYPRIAQVIESDLSYCAQRRPGDSIKFREVSFSVAKELLTELEEELQRISKSIKMFFSV